MNLSYLPPKNQKNYSGEVNLIYYFLIDMDLANLISSKTLHENLPSNFKCLYNPTTF